MFIIINISVETKSYSYVQKARSLHSRDNKFMLIYCSNTARVRVRTFYICYIKDIWPQSVHNYFYISAIILIKKISSQDTKSNTVCNIIYTT